MPRFRVHMESPDLKRADGSPHIRVTTGVFDDEDAARLHCERQEMRIAAHEYPAATLAEMEALELAAIEAAEIQGAAMRQAAGSSVREAAEANGLDPGEVDAVVEAAEKAVVSPVGQASAQVRMRLATHRQTKPYVIVDIEEMN